MFAIYDELVDLIFQYIFHVLENASTIFLNFIPGWPVQRLEAKWSGLIPNTNHTALAKVQLKTKDEN